VETNVVAVPLIRPATDDDLDALWASSIGADRLQRRLQLAKRGEETFLVAELDGHAVGMLSVRWAGSCDGNRPWLYGGEVLPQWRRQGIGTLLWGEAERIARHYGATQVSLDVERTNGQARRLYERLGYAIIRRHAHPWCSIDPVSGAVCASGTSDTWIMRKELVLRTQLHTDP
jgi:ribosomal protein S18 acetylase RimI-like enzyme